MSGSTATLDLQPGPSPGHFRWVWILSALLCLGLCACVNLTDYENAQVLDSVPLDYTNPEQQLGQSILIRRTPLTGIQLWLRLSDEAEDLDSQLVFRIFSGDQFESERYAGQISYAQIASNYPLLITIPEQELVPGEQILLTLEASGSPVWVYGRAEDNYPSGEFFQNGNPINADAAFRLSYAYNIKAGIQDLGNLASQAGQFLLVAVVLLLPGWVLLQLGSLRSRYEITQLIALAIGLSLAILPLLMAWTSLVGLSWSKVVVIFGFIALLIFAIGWEIWHRRTRPESKPNRAKWQDPEFLALIALLTVFLVTLFIRFAMVRDLSGPAWVDPVHHALISRLIQETGQLPPTFAPYASTPSANYHTGFHVTAALYSWLTGGDNADSLLFLGQVLNAAAVLAAYLLTREITGSRLAGLVAAVVTGFATPMPAYYTSWGRYTHLAGLLILPTGFVLLRSLYARSDLIEENAAEITNLGEWRAVLLAAVAVAGLFLVHTRVAIFLFTLLLADLLTWAILAGVSKATPRPKLQFLPLLLALVSAVLLALPDLYPLLTRLLPERAAEWGQTAAVEPIQLSWRYITTGLGEITLGIALVGGLAAVFRRTRVALLLVLWVGLMFVSANLIRLGLPINLPISNDSVVITLFLPTAVAVGVLFSEINAWLKISPWKTARPLGLGLVLALCLLTIYFGTRALLPIINPITVYLRQGDLQAADWINENLPEEADMLINPAPWGYGVYVGADGGYWLSPLTGRLTFPPTLLYAHGSRETIAAINMQARDLLAAVDDPQAIEDFLRTHQMEYVYLGARGGPISPLMLLQSPSFELIYHQAGAWLFRLSAPVNQ
jgi:hypothetical protein